jgi:hypothetical protein
VVPKTNAALKPSRLANPSLLTVGCAPARREFGFGGFTARKNKARRLTLFVSRVALQYDAVAHPAFPPVMRAGREVCFVSGGRDRALSTALNVK